MSATQTNKKNRKDNNKTFQALLATAAVVAGMAIVEMTVHFHSGEYLFLAGWVS